MTRAARRAAMFWAVVLASAAPAHADDRAIAGRISVTPEAAGSIRPGDRLVIRMYHPDDGIEKDLKYWILDTFALPQSFLVAPTATMAGKVRWSDYVVEAFTDRDGDVLSLIAGEVFASTGTPVALGSSGVELVLDRAE